MSNFGLSIGCQFPAWSLSEYGDPKARISKMELMKESDFVYAKSRTRIWFCLHEETELHSCIETKDMFHQRYVSASEKVPD
jgi:hypothetical protein